MSLLIIITNCTKKIIINDYKSWCYERVVEDTEFISLSDSSRRKVLFLETKCID